MFTTDFKPYTCDNDTITCTVDGFDCVATIRHDLDSSAPDAMEDGFWPSLNPRDAGYIGDGKTQADMYPFMAQAHAVMDAWKRDEWWYVGVAVTVSRASVKLTERYSHATWGIECNYPQSDNTQLRVFANDLLPDALKSARAKLAELCGITNMTPCPQNDGKHSFVQCALCGACSTD